MLLLDLNLNGQDGFDILKDSVAASYHTIVVSANTDRALEAFEYGVLDFVGKPFNQQRLEKAFERLNNTRQQGAPNSRYLSVKKQGRIEIIELNQIRYIRAEGQFERVHKSYVVPMNQIKALLKHPGSKYELKLQNDECIPLGRTRYGSIRDKLES